MKKVIVFMIINLIFAITLLGCSNNSTELKKQSEKPVVVASNKEYKIDIKMNVDENNKPIINKNGKTSVTIVSNNSEFVHDIFVVFKSVNDKKEKLKDATYNNWKVAAGETKTLDLDMKELVSENSSVEVNIITAMVGNQDNSSKTSVSASNNDKTLRSGQSIILNKDTLVCSSKDNLDKMLSFLNANNKEGANSMLLNGQATMLKKGTKVNVVDSGVFVTQIETVNGDNWFAPRETIQDSL